jgi:amino-acid N-acetyltransferase
VEAVAKTNTMIIDQAQNYKDKVRALLIAEKLPVDDLPADLDNFLVAMQDDDVIGVAGLEIYGSYGLLRSLAVNPDHRSKGIAGKLLLRIEELAALKALKEVYLLTETAPEYFNHKGYVKVTRGDVPAGVQQSSEFNHVCPQSAIVMKKII